MIRRVLSIRLSWAMVCFAGALFAPVMAQQAPAILSGRVVDPSEAVVPSASVAVTGRQGQSKKTVTSADGSFQFEDLDAGTWELRVSREEFGEQTRSVVLLPGQTVELTITLHPRSVSQSVNVVESADSVSGSVTKMDVPLLQIPQAITVIDRAQLEEQAPLTLQEALRYTSGISTDTYGIDARGDWAVVRGGEDWGQYLNGLRMLFWYNSYTRPDPYALERIEVMRGPSSVLFGQSGFGGVINLISKRPLERHHREIQVQLGSFRRRQVAVDVTGPIDRDSKWLYRFIGLGRDSNTQVKHVPNDRLLVAPSLTWRPKATTSLTILTTVQEDRSGSTIGFFPWQGTLFDHPLGRIPTDTFISEPGFDEYRTDQATIGYLFQHEMNSRWTLRQNFNYTQGHSSYQSIYTAFDPVPTFNEDNRTVNRELYMSKQTARSPVIDTQSELRFETGLIRHTLLTGVDYQTSSVNQRMAFGPQPPIDVFNPQYGNYTVPALTLMPKQSQRQVGVYAQDHVNLGERWSATFGIRKDWARSETEGDPASRNDDGAVTGRAGVVYSAAAGITPYFNYSQSFQPMAGTDIFNRPYDPIRGRQVETGVRFHPGADNHFISTALFDIREENRLTPDPQNPLNQTQLGEARVRGLEIEGRSKLPRNVNLLVNYSFLDARVSKSNGPDQGKRLPVVPKHIASLWGVKSLRIDGLPGMLTAGGGIRYNGHSFGGDDFIRTPAYTLFDLMVAYDSGKWRLAVNAANVTDKVYVASCLARGDCFYGVRRTITATIAYRF